MDGEQHVVVVDVQRLRAGAVAAALRARGVAASDDPDTAATAALAVVHADAADRLDLLGRAGARTPYLLLAGPAGTADAGRGAAGRAALAVLPSAATFDTLETAVRAALRGAAVPQAPAGSADRPAPTAEHVVSRLSARERDVLACLSRGRRNDEIGDDLGISAHTVRTHVQNILGKLEVTNRHAAVMLARSGGLGHDRGGRR